MKFKQFLVPIMAMVFAIGMSFATEKSAATAYINDGNDNPIAVMVSGCEEDEDEQCFGQFEGDNTEYELFQNQGLDIPLKGGGSLATITRIINP